MEHRECSNSFHFNLYDLWAWKTDQIFGSRQQSSVWILTRKHFLHWCRGFTISTEFQTEPQSHKCVCYYNTPEPELDQGQWWWPGVPFKIPLKNSILRNFCDNLPSNEFFHWRNFSSESTRFSEENVRIRLKRN